MNKFLYLAKELKYHCCMIKEDVLMGKTLDI